MHLRESAQSARSQSWSTPSASPSPPPPPLPPPVINRWARAERNSGELCPHCRGHIASLPTRTTSLSSYSICKDRTTPISRLPEDEDSFPVLCDRELHSLHRNIPALRRRDVDTATIKQHYYPEGGWGWLVCGAAFLAYLLTSGFQLAFGLLYLYVIKFLIKEHMNKQFYSMATAWMGAMCLSISFLIAPFVVAVSRRKSTRLAAVMGGLLMALACLFTSFAVQFHQALLSYGVVLGAGAGIVRETSGLVLGHYFKKRREFVEMVAQSGTGVGMALFSVLYKEAVGKLGWRLGLHSVTGLLALAFFLPIVYRSANLYHPQRRAIMHLKNQRKKMKEKKTHAKGKKPAMFDFTPLKSRGLRVLLVASATGSLGVYSPIFYLALQGHDEGLEDSALVLLQTFLGFATALGFVGFGLIIVRPNTQCLISRQYLCQTSLIGIGISLLALSAVQGYHGYVLFVWLYGVCLGGFDYSLKMFTLERIRTRHFTKAWSFVQGAKSVPVLIGIPITGYMNQIHPKAGYYFSFGTTLVSASLMFLVGHRKDSSNGNYSFSPKMNECICNLNNHYITEVPYNVYRPPPLNQYEQFLPSYDHLDRSSFCRHSSMKHRYDRPVVRHCLPKSQSYVANIHHSAHPSMICLNRSPGVTYPHKYSHGNLRATRSVPEGLARWSHYGSCRRPIIRDVHVIEQITTSV
ncbi:monocarboxylate transporter 2-like [Agrilus planipennis]|uniref:Monocarboxylate transporter 2-like n=1 Tax=Agrilus planipennis TaxID=224129 RepID=A0A7F5RLY9_AGRPL|nr:monocarboxylate transporter 2-like [Agrilus planipennis]XP_025837039.1 monocarboxylate transporter 2-like [Agrilus planipennis]XP_025837041.1 monocarboxylate transporter 2-like [Agrilus planipennis]XP_025837042.1 monocarboxylate transporter 2-like [Agrilus planipennis]